MPHYYIKMLKKMKKEDIILFLIIVEEIKKFYLKHYPRKRLLAMHDFTPEKKEMREVIKNVKDAKYKALLFDVYTEEK